MWRGDTLNPRGGGRWPPNPPGGGSRLNCTEAFLGEEEGVEAAQAEAAPSESFEGAAIPTAQVGIDVAGAAAQPGPGAPKPVQLLTSGEVKSSQYGYGPDGASVQDKLHRPDLTDRVVMQKTILCGRPVITIKQATECMQSSRQDGKKALPQPMWMKVMQAGLDGCQVAKLDGRNVCVKEIPADIEGRMVYHNELMHLCGISLRQLVEAMKATRAKDDKRKAEKGHKRQAADAATVEGHGAHGKKQRGQASTDADHGNGAA